MAVAVLFVCLYEFPEPPTILTIENAPVFRPSSPSEIKTIEQALYTVITVVRDDLQLGAVDPLIVYTYKNNASFGRYGPGLRAGVDAAHIAAGATGNEIHINLAAFKTQGLKESPVGQLLEVFAHEYAHNLHHAVIAQPPPVPNWFSEGFAGWVVARVLHSLGWQSYEISLHRATRELMHHQKSLSSLSALDDRARWNEQARSPNGAIKSYVLATVAVHRLIQKEGLEAVMNYFRTGIFASSFRVPWEEFVKEFDNYVQELRSSKTLAFRLQKPEWKIGDRWVYSRTVSGKNDRIGREVIKDTEFEGLPCFLVYEENENVLYTKDSLAQFVNFEDGKLVTRRNKPNMLLNWPLEQGKEWRNSYTFDDLKRQTSGVSDRLMTIPNLETIRVPAGLFDTAKVEAYDRDSGRLIAEYWYSPQVKWFVRARWYTAIEGFKEYELVSFSPAG